MRWIPAFALLTLGLFLGAMPAYGAPTPVKGALEYQGRVRTYLLTVPPQHDRAKPVPLVLALHGGGGKASQFDRSTKYQMSREAVRRGWIVAYPNGVNNGWNDGRRLVTRRERARLKVDDVGFLAALIDRLHATHGIDKSRVYATGISNGGFMSYRLGIELGAKIAAIAPVTANLQRMHVGKKPTHPMPVLILNGTKDPLVPYRGGHVQVLGQKRGAIVSTDATVAWWCRHNGCSGTVQAMWLPDRDRRDGTRVHVSRHLGPAPVVLYRIQGGGHTWPGGQQYLPKLLIGPVCRDIDAGRVIFDFFAQHRRPQPTATPR